MGNFLLFWGLILLPFVLPLAPLFVYCLRQERRRRLFSRGTVGLVVGGMGGLLTTPLLFSGSAAGMSPETGIMGMLLLADGGGLVGAYLGVSRAECNDPDPERSSGAQRGLLYGLGVGAPVGLALVLIGLGEDRFIWVVMVAALLLGGAIGAMVGATRASRSAAPMRRRS